MMDAPIVPNVFLKAPLPVVHLNGTSAAQLLEQRESALVALRELVVAMNVVTPHGRDYLREQDYRDARHAHVEMQRALLLIEQTLRKQYEAVADQQLTRIVHLRAREG